MPTRARSCRPSPRVDDTLARRAGHTFMVLKGWARDEPEHPGVVSEIGPGPVTGAIARPHAPASQGVLSTAQIAALRAPPSWRARPPSTNSEDQLIEVPGAKETCRVVTEMLHDVGMRERRHRRPDPDARHRIPRARRWSAGQAVKTPHDRTERPHHRRTRSSTSRNPDGIRPGRPGRVKLSRCTAGREQCEWAADSSATTKSAGSACGHAHFVAGRAGLQWPVMSNKGTPGAQSRAKPLT